MKWTASDYTNPFQDWKPPKLVYPCSATEKEALQHLKDIFTMRPPYKRKSEREIGMEWEASKSGSLVTIDTPIPDGYFAFLENTAERCTSPATKHSQKGKRGARHWVQRVDTAEGLFRRLTDGYGVSLMFGERCHQYIRNSNNWRGTSGAILDIDLWRDDKHPEAPEPVYSREDLLDEYPLLADICSFILPTASSLYEGRPYLSRGLILFPEPITDQRVYRAFGDILLAELGFLRGEAGEIIQKACIPNNVTKNPVAVGFGNTHNAPEVWRNLAPNSDWIQNAFEQAQRDVISSTQKRNREQKAKSERSKHYRKQRPDDHNAGENISAFIEQCDPVAEMVRDGLLTPGRGNDYRWHESEHERSCDILDGVIHIFSHSMSAASPAPELEPVGAHRFYLYQLSGLDMTKASDKAKCREFLFERGYGDDPKAFAQGRKKVKLQRSDDTPSEPTETLADNRAHRETATDTFLKETIDENTLHMFIVKDATGTGKSHTTLFKARQHGKRTLGQYQYSELAAQAVEVARQAGFKNPLHLLGREHNWDDSGIAEIPVEERTEALFASNNCLMVDKVKEYTDKRIAPRTFCELFCPFHYEEKGGKKRNICRHLAQYEGLEDRDFVSNCTPNLPFDLTTRGYLKSLVNTKDELSDEALAIDAMLGTESEETTDFDFAILDDYSINGLYADITFSASDFKAVKKAWCGTPTAKFAKLLLKAFEKKKPQKIVKALREAFETTAEHHKDIAMALTMHARNGTVQWAASPKSSKETKRLLAEKVVQYDDGGRTFIPVDYDAYKELRDKDIPCVHPQKLQTQDGGERVRVPHTVAGALLAGVELQGLTPVWTPGATPIELLDIFLKSIGNDKNASIHRMFRAGDPPVAILTFSIPPQAPIGILPHIALLSATTDPEDIKRPFDGQSVTFSEHIGGQLGLAPGVQVYQYQDARLTSASVFEYPKDADGKRKLQDAPIGLKPTAEKRLRKLNDWAKAKEGLTAFISYKEFTEHLGEVVNGFDIVTHFDKVAGLNFDGLKYLVVFGYPKVKHEVVMAQARRQHTRDSEPLPKGTYAELTETTEYQEDGFTIYERRYKDPRLEKVRHQLSTEKLDQAMGRARFFVWADTETILFTNAPSNGITNQANLFSLPAFNLAEAPSDLPDAMARIKAAEDSGDVRSMMETKGISQRQAYNDTKDVRDQKEEDRDARILELHNEGKSQREIEKQMKSEGYQKAGKTTIQKVVTFCSHQLININYELQKVTTPSDVAPPCVESKNTENGNGVHTPIPRGEYSKLTQQEARAELQNCEGNFDYTGAAYLRTLFKRNGWDIASMGENPQEQEPEIDVQVSVDTDTPARILALYYNQLFPRDIANDLDLTTEEVFAVLDAQPF